jgi:hypothetical protein
MAAVSAAVSCFIRSVAVMNPGTYPFALNGTKGRRLRSALFFTIA